MLLRLDALLISYSNQFKVIEATSEALLDQGFSKRCTLKKLYDNAQIILFVTLNLINTGKQKQKHPTTELKLKD